MTSSWAWFAVLVAATGCSGKNLPDDWGNSRDPNDWGPASNQTPSSGTSNDPNASASSSDGGAGTTNPNGNGDPAGPGPSGPDDPAGGGFDGGIEPAGGAPRTDPPRVCSELTICCSRPKACDRERYACQGVALLKDELLCRTLLTQYETIGCDNQLNAGAALIPGFSGCVRRPGGGYY